jgi:glycyl-tRNA synthetase (class II)
VCEFTLAEIEHFVDPEDKSHPIFYVANLEFLMFPRELQLPGESVMLMKLGEAVAKVNNFLHFCLQNLISFLLFICDVLTLDIILNFYTIVIYRELLITIHLVTSPEGSIFS